MNKKVLLVEDNEYMNSTLIELLENNDFEVCEAVSISEAKSHFKKVVNFIIVDLNVSPEGLNVEEYNETEGLLLSGWVWLQNYVFKEKPEYKKKVIIYSAYVQTLKKKYPDEVKNIKLVDKSQKTPSEVIGILNGLK